MQRARFWFDGMAGVEGWDDGSRWNGFGVPIFGSNQVDNAVMAMRAVGLSVCLRGDALTIADPDAPPEEVQTIPRGPDGLWRVDAGLTWNVEKAEPWSERLR
jgi:hypothetical protein